MGPLFMDLVANTLKHTRRISVIQNIVAGIGGVNITYTDFTGLIKDFISIIESGGEPPVFKWYHRR